MIDVARALPEDPDELRAFTQLRASINAISVVIGAQNRGR